MKALILAAGRGTRVKPLTYSVPKPMLPILNKPVMEFLVDLLREHGFSQVMVNTSYLPTEIERYFRDGARFGVEMSYSFEGYLDDGCIIDEPLGSAGALKEIQDHSGFFDSTFVVMCGDAIVDVDLSRLVSLHKSKGALATIALDRVPRSQVSSYGVVVTDRDGWISEFQEKPTTEAAKSTTVNTGIYVFEPEVIERIPSGTSWDIGADLFPALMAEQVPFYGASIPLQWLDIGKVCDYYRVIQMALQGKVPRFTMPGIQKEPGLWMGLNVRADLSLCNIVPPVYIGGSVALEPGCTIIGPSMIGPGSIIEWGAHIERSAIFDYTRIDANAEVKDMIVCGDYCVDASGTVIDLKRSAVDWAITDARNPRAALSRDQRELLEMLFDSMGGWRNHRYEMPRANTTELACIQ